MAQSRFTHEQVKARFARFDAMMQGYGIPLQPDSRLKRAMDEMTDFVDALTRRVSRTTRPGHASLIREMLGAFTLANAVLSVESSKLFPALVPHLRAIAGAPGALVAQNARSETGNDQTTNQMFELLMAAPMLKFAENIKLDHPTKSKGIPDIVVRVDGVLWAIECKTPWSPDPQKYRDKVDEAIGQLRRFNCDRRLVFVSLRNLIQHDTLFSQSGDVFVTPSSKPESVFQDEFRRVLRKVSEETLDDVPALFDSTNVERCIFNYAASVGIANDGGNKILTPMDLLWPVFLDSAPAPPAPDAPVLAFHRRLVTAMRDNYRQ